MKQFFFRVILVFVSTGISLGLVEWYLRREVSYVVRRDVAGKGRALEMSPEFLVEHVGGQRRLVPNADVVIKNHYISHRDVSVRTNSLGFRGPELGTKAADEKRILLLGDSIALSEYLPEEETYPVLLQTRLRSSLAPVPLNVINSGVTNIGTEEEIGILEERGFKVDPDLLLLAYYLNDSRPPWGFSGELGDRGWLRRHSLLYETLYTRVRQSSWLKSEQQKMRFEWIPAQHTLQWKTSPEQLKQLAHLARFDWGAAWEEASWGKTADDLRHFAAVAAAHKKRALIAIFPVKFQVEADFIDDSSQKHVAKIAAQLGLPVIDLLPALRPHAAEELFYDQCHFTALGQKYVAAALAEMLLPLMRVVP